MLSAVFFLSVKIKSSRENPLWVFFGFFHGQKNVFTHTFFCFFHAHLFFSRALFLFFFTGGKFDFTGTNLNFFPGWYFFSKNVILSHPNGKIVSATHAKIEFKNIFLQINEVFSRTLFTFHGHNFKFFSRAPNSVSRVEFQENFHGHFFFSRTLFLIFFTGGFAFFMKKKHCVLGWFNVTSISFT